MNATKMVLCSTAIALLLAGCSTSSSTTAQASTATTLGVEGIAATGYAMTGAKIEIANADGATLYTGVTNELGAYAASLERKNLSLPLTVSVTQGDVKYENIIATLPDSASDSALTAHINPITAMVATTLKGQYPDLKQITARICDSVSQVRVEALLGEGVQYAAFASKNGYVAAVQGDTTLTPSAEDMVLHALKAQATESGVPVQEFLATQSQLHAHLLTSDAAFQTKLTLQMQDFKMASAEIQQGLRSMLSVSKADSLEQTITQIHAQYSEMAIPAECSNDSVQAQIQVVLSLQIQLQKDSSNNELRTQMETAAMNLQNTMTQTQVQCSVSFTVPEIPGSKTSSANGSSEMNSSIENRSSSSVIAGSSESALQSSEGTSSATGTMAPSSESASSSSVSDNMPSSTTQGASSNSAK